MGGAEEGKREREGACRVGVFGRHCSSHDNVR